MIGNLKIAIISGKGGSGKSSVSAAFAALADRVVAVDCDVDASNLPLIFPHEVLQTESFASGISARVDPERCMGCGRCAGSCAFGAITLVNGIAQVNPFFCEGCGLCRHLCPDNAIGLEEVSYSQIFESRFRNGLLIHGDLHPGDDHSGKMIACLREIADRRMREEDIRLQLLDGPPGIGCPVLSTVTGEDRVVIVCEPTLSGMADLERAWQVAGSFCRDIMVIINKADLNLMNRNAISAFCRDRKLPVVAELPFDRQIVDAQLHCQSIVDYAPASNCAHALRSAWKKVSL